MFRPVGPIRTSRSDGCVLNNGLFEISRGVRWLNDLLGAINLQAQVIRSKRLYTVGMLECGCGTSRGAQRLACQISRLGGSKPRKDII